jgi:predicted anti-sigma-YlaC factor YlaD
MVTFSLADCDRARESVSAELDGELPELERERLSAHLRTCPGCSVWAAQVEDATLRLRDAALQAPLTPVAVERRTARRWAVAPAVAVSSAAALVASLVVAIGPQTASLGPRNAAASLSLAEARQASHPLGGSRVFTGHAVGLDNQLGIAAIPAEPRAAGNSATRVPS